MTFTDEELAWIKKQASKQIAWLESRPSREQLRSSLFNWRDLIHIGEKPVPRRSLSVLRRYVANVIESLQFKIIPGYKERIKGSNSKVEAERYNDYIHMNEEKIEELYKPLLAKLETRLRK